MFIEKVKPGDRFKHFKTGGFYKITSIFTWEPTKEPSVEYEHETTGERWGRPISVFLEDVVDPTTFQPVPRFEKLKDAKDKVICYGLEEKYDDNGQPYWLVHHWGGDIIATLQGGTSAIIVLSFLNMSRTSDQRGDDYMSGVIAGCTHMQLLGRAPTDSTSNSPTSSPSTPSKPMDSTSP